MQRTPTSPGSRKNTPRRAILAWDRLWLRRWQRVRLPRRLHLLLLLFVRAGDGWIWVAAAAFLALVLPGREFGVLAGQGLTAAVVSLPAYRFLKRSFRRTRPHRMFARVVARVSPVDVHSFPSGHTMNNLAIAGSLAFHLPWLWPIALAVPLLLGLLRVLFGVHYVSDVIGGALFGLMAASAAYGIHALLLALSASIGG